MVFHFSIHFLPVIICSAVSFAFGALWYSPLLFGAQWVEELKKHSVTITEPSTGEMATKLSMSALINTSIAFFMALLVSLTGSANFISGLTLGLIAVLGFAATTLGSVFTWESRSLKLYLIDLGYPAVSIITSAIILSLWH